MRVIFILAFCYVREHLLLKNIIKVSKENYGPPLVLTFEQVFNIIKLQVVECTKNLSVWIKKKKGIFVPY